MTDLLVTAEEQCREFVYKTGQPTDPDPLPFRYTLATIMQARELYNAGQRDNADVVGVGDFGLRAGDLTRHVKRLLRPAVVTWRPG
jgi:hypothetical protein